MSDFKVEVVEIEEILPHPNADRLEIAKIHGWYCVTGKGRFHAKDRAVYFPIDSVLPPALELQLFPPESKIKLTKSRIKTIKIRGAISQGLIVSPSELDMEHAPVGTDATEALGVKKFEPEESMIPASMNGPSVQRQWENPNFKEYTKITNAKNHCPFQEGEQVVATEKIHGTNFRAGWVRYVPFGAWEKIKAKYLSWWFDVPKYEFVYGSHHRMFRLREGREHKDVYSEMVQKYDLVNLLPRGMTFYGEIYGGGIQKGYTYGLDQNEHDMIIIDISNENGDYLDYSLAEVVTRNLGLSYAPIVYKGSFNYEDMRKLTLGPSILNPAQVVREGLVVRSINEVWGPFGRKLAKFISDEYLLRDNTDFH